MTVSTTTNRIAHACNGATTSFAVPFSFFAPTDLVVIERVDASGAETVRALTTDYTVAGGAGATGTVTALSAPPAGRQWIIKRVLPRTQGMDLTPNDPFPASTVEQSHDRAVMLVQELEEALSRAIKFPQTDSVLAELPALADRKSKYLAFGATGELSLASGTTNTPIVSAFIETLLDDVTAGAARTTLGLGTAAIASTGTATGNVPLAEHVIGKQTIWVPAIAMIARTTNGAASGTAETTTNKIMLKTADFDTATQEFMQFAIHMSKGWNRSTVTFQPVWSHAAAATFGVVFALQAVALSDDDAADAAFGTEQTSTDTGGTTNDIYIGPESAAITVGGSPAENDYVVFQVKRNVSDANDTLNVDARLIGIKLFYITNTGVDS
ncbi:MAG: hypothetical protein ACKVSF_11125 [Alphaproteobacteria bacterium]